jgi:pyridoxamine 5'-phosphate oxidase
MDPQELDYDPVAQFTAWLEEAGDGPANAAAMTLATATPDGRPSARVVLLRGVDARGFVFFTNRDSQKGAELAGNPRAALVFHWSELGRQVRVEGGVEEISPEESATYWETRPRRSRIAAWASPQSEPIADRAALDAKYAAVESQFHDSNVPLPPFWGGYRVKPETVEFWLHRDDRLHDRVRYTRAGEEWTRERLAP